MLFFSYSVVRFYTLVSFSDDFFFFFYSDEISTIIVLGFTLLKRFTHSSKLPWISISQYISTRNTHPRKLDCFFFTEKNYALLFDCYFKVRTMQIKISFYFQKSANQEKNHFFFLNRLSLSARIGIELYRAQMKLVHNNHRINFVRTVKEGAKFVMSHTARYICIGENANGIFHVFLFQPKSAMFTKPSDWCGIIPSVVVGTARIDWFFGAPAQYTKHEYSTKPLCVSDSFMPVERHIVYCWLNPPYTCNRHNKISTQFATILYRFLSYSCQRELQSILKRQTRANIWR